MATVDGAGQKANAMRNGVIDPARAARAAAVELTPEPLVKPPLNASAPRSEKVDVHPPMPEDLDIVAADTVRDRETFIPVTRHALIDRLTQARAWPPGDAVAARRFFTYLDYWRHQRYQTRILELEQIYEPFSPDTDLLMTRKYTERERASMQGRVVEQMRTILEQANYRCIKPEDVEIILTKESHYGLDLHVDFSAFDEVMIYYRGASTMRDQRRSLRKFMRKEEFDVPVFQRLFLLFKLKPFEDRVLEVMKKERLPRKEAEKKITKLRALLPRQVREENIYMKLFKNIPRSDVEMVFPNTIIKFRLFDKIKLGVTSAGGIGAGLASTVPKVIAGGALLSNPIVLIGAMGALGAAAFRQFMNFNNTKQRYMVTMAQNLYFHSLADNRGVMILLADRAAEEDVKEEILLYSVLAKEPAHRNELQAIDTAIEKYLRSAFGVTVDFDLDDALGRLIADGLVREDADGTLHTLAPREAALHLDAKWDRMLDELPDVEALDGVEFDGQAESRATANFNGAA